MGGGEEGSFLRLSVSLISKTLAGSDQTMCREVTGCPFSNNPDSSSFIFPKGTSLC